MSAVRMAACTCAQKRKSPRPPHESGAEGTPQVRRRDRGFVAVACVVCVCGYRDRLLLRPAAAGNADGRIGSRIGACSAAGPVRRGLAGHWPRRRPRREAFEKFSAHAALVAFTTV